MFYGRFKDESDREFLREAVKRFRTMFSNVFAGDNVILFTRTLGFRHDKKFMEAYRRQASNQLERSLFLRLNTLVWAASEALRIPGDFVECGVWRGFCMSVVADYLDFQNVPKKFYLYDTFAGIPPGYDTENHNSPSLSEPNLYENVVQRFSIYPNVQVIRGVVPDSFEQAVPERVAFLHLDMNSSKAEIAALNVLFDRISPGGIIVFDDYGWTSYVAQQVAEDKFMRARGHRILELPSGQGLLIKH
jgi:hypothetical protein